MGAEQSEQGSVRRPRWWPLDRGAALIVVLATGAIALYAVLVPLHAAAYGSPVAMTMALGLGAVAAPLVSLRHPNIAMAVFTSAALLLPLMVDRAAALSAPWPWSVPMLIAFGIVVVAVTFRHGWRPGLVQLALGTAAGVAAAAMLPSIPAGVSLIVTTSVVAGLYLVAVLLAGRLRLGAELTRERAHTAQEQSRRELVEERTRIARELHDVVAHSMSLIQVQASTARYRVPGLQAEAAAEFDEIAASARSALTEMRRILGVLRTDDHTAELAPQRGVDDIPMLVETTRRAGATVSLSHTVDGEISPATQLAAYRITQEALSNAVRHAPGAPIAVTVIADPADVRVTIRNPHSAGVLPPPGGHGVRGMMERAGLLGGSVSAGPDGQGNWIVDARMPRSPAVPATEGPQ